MNCTTGVLQSLSRVRDRADLDYLELRQVGGHDKLFTSHKINCEQAKHRGRVINLHLVSHVSWPPHLKAFFGRLTPSVEAEWVGICKIISRLATFIITICTIEEIFRSLSDYELCWIRLSMYLSSSTIPGPIFHFFSSWNNSRWILSEVACLSLRMYTRIQIKQNS